MEYKRRFIILNKEDSKYCQDGCTGYCKIEVLKDKANIKVFVQGLKHSIGDLYKIYLISYFENEFCAVNIGNIDSTKAKSEINTSVNPSNVLSSNIPISEFNIAAIVVKDNEFQYPLVGYDKITQNNVWRSKFERFIQCRKKTDSNKVLEQKENDINQKKENINKTETQSNIVIDVVDKSIFEYIKSNNIEKINQIMSTYKNVSEFNPFEKSKLKYKWWKISDMSVMNNILANNIMASQFFKHPLIKKKLREQNYCLYGLVSDVDNNIKYMTFGFPSQYYSNDQIYIGGFSVFYPAKGFEKKNGDFGYWVVHIKIDNQNIVMNT